MSWPKASPKRKGQMERLSISTIAQIVTAVFVILIYIKLF